MHTDHSTSTIVIAEDDPNIAALVARYLKREGFKPVLTQDGTRALDLIDQHRPEMVILDLMLPGMDGWEICRRIRRNSDLPILMLTAREEEIDRVAGLSMGADDYVVKPFSPRELVERVKAILRRAERYRGGAAGVETEPLTHGELELVPEKHRVTLGGKEISLTHSEYTLLFVLMQSPGRVFTREQLLDHLHEEGEVVIDRVVDVHIGRLRRKIEPEPASPRFVLTVRGTGYRFADREGT